MWNQILKIRYIHEASSVRKAKSSNILFLWKNFVKSVRKQYKNPDFTFFFKIRNTFVQFQIADFKYFFLFFINKQTPKICWFFERNSFLVWKNRQFLQNSEYEGFRGRRLQIRYQIFEFQNGRSNMGISIYILFS